MQPWWTHLNLMIAVSLLVDRKVVGGGACEERQAEGEESTLCRSWGGWWSALWWQRGWSDQASHMWKIIVIIVTASESPAGYKKSQRIRCSWRHVVFEGVATFQRQKQLARDIESDGIPSQLRWAPSQSNQITFNGLSWKCWKRKSENPFWKTHCPFLDICMKNGNYDVFIGRLQSSYKYTSHLILSDIRTSSLLFVIIGSHSTVWEVLNLRSHYRFDHHSHPPHHESSSYNIVITTDNPTYTLQSWNNIAIAWRIYSGCSTPQLCAKSSVCWRK